MDNGHEGLKPRRVGQQKGLWEFDYEDPLRDRIQAVYGHDVLVWIDAAWAAMLIQQGIIRKEHAATVAAAARAFVTQTPAGYGGFGGLERYVCERHGVAAGGNLTIGRTVPSMDQMTRVRRELLKAMCVVYDVQDTLLDVAETALDAVMPGYTHIRHAQPTTFGHYLLSVFDPLERSMQQTEAGCHLMSLNELGCGALAGTSLPIDRDLVSAYLGLDDLIENANDAVAYTDGYVTVVAALANVNAVMSRFTLDLNIWSSEEVAFLDVPWVRFVASPKGEAIKQAHTHSHFMPNKTNNCPTLERSRVAAAEVLGALTEVTMMGMRTPHADMHEMLHMADATLRAIHATAYYTHPYIFTLPAMTLNRAQMLRSVQTGWSSATELGNRLVLEHGLDYRTVHDILNVFINASKQAGIPAGEARLADLETAAEAVIGRSLGMTEETLRRSLDPVGFVSATCSAGGVAVAETTRMLAVRRERMQACWARHEGRVRTLEQARQRLLADLERMML